MLKNYMETYHTNDETKNKHQLEGEVHMSLIWHLKQIENQIQIKF